MTHVHIMNFSRHARSFESSILRFYHIIINRLFSMLECKCMAFWKSHCVLNCVVIKIDFRNWGLRVCDLTYLLLTLLFFHSFFLLNLSEYFSIYLSLSFPSSFSGSTISLQVSIFSIFLYMHKQVWKWKCRP